MQQLLNWQQKQKLLADTTANREALLSCGEFYRGMGILSEAAELLSAAGALDVVEKILGEAVADGDLFVAQAAAFHLKRPLTKDEVSTLAQRAEALGKLVYAAKALALIGDPRAAELQAQFQQTMQPDPATLLATTPAEGNA